MPGKHRAVFGIYSSGDAAERAVDALIDARFPSGHISVLLPDTHSHYEFAHRKETKAPEGTAAGTLAGGVIGGTIGVLAGVGALAIPGAGSLVAAGPLLAGFAGLGLGGAMGGGLGALIGAGMPEYEAKRFDGRARRGGTLLSVHCDTARQIRAAKELLRETGAQDIASEGESAPGAPEDRRASAALKAAVDPRVTRDTHGEPHGRNSYVGDPSDPADLSHPRIYR